MIPLILRPLFQSGLAPLLLLALTGCSGAAKSHPTLRTRPNFTGPHAVVKLECVAAVGRGQIEWFNGPNGTMAWCDIDSGANGLVTLSCHDVVLKNIPEGCIAVASK